MGTAVLGAPQLDEGMGSERINVQGRCDRSDSSAQRPLPFLSPLN